MGSKVAAREAVHGRDFKSGHYRSFWVAESAGASGVRTRAQALSQIEKTLLWARSSIPEGFP